MILILFIYLLSVTFFTICDCYYFHYLLLLSAAILLWSFAPMFLGETVCNFHFCIIFDYSSSKNRVGEIELIFKPRKSLYIIAILMFGENNLKSRCYFC